MISVPEYNRYDWQGKIKKSITTGGTVENKLLFSDEMKSYETGDIWKRTDGTEAANS